MDETLSARQRILNVTADLLERQGYYGTGLNQIIQESKAPKGSLYYYFPEGKEELVAEALSLKATTIASELKNVLDAMVDPIEAIQYFIQQLINTMRVSDCHMGGPIATVAMETSATSERLRQASESAYETWRQIFADKLLAGGYPADKAGRLSMLIITSLEGAIIVTRTRQNTQPLEAVLESLLQLLRFEASQQ